MAFEQSVEEQRLKKIGLLPGSPVYIGEKREVKPAIYLINYSKDFYHEHVFEVNEIDKILKHVKPKHINWLIVVGVNNVEIVQQIGELFNLHPLTVEDIVNTRQRPKLESYESYVYIVEKLLEYKDDIEEEQLSIIIKNNILITFHETEHKIIETIKHRLNKNRGDIRKKGIDFLVYSILDITTDQYFVLLEKLGEEIEILEQEIIEKPNVNLIIKVQETKRKTIMLRKILWPLRETISKFSALETKILKRSTRLYLRDVHDHVIQVLETIETYRDILASMIDIYLSNINNKINEVIKVLTIITTIFIPLTFITSIYGMNFKYMPELEHPFGYYAVLIVLFLIASLMVIYFKRKGWLD